MTSIASSIKNRIKTDLDALVTAGTLKEVQMDDFKTSPLFDRNIAQYPCAIVTGPSIEGINFTNCENIRTHTFAVVIMEKMENISTDGQIEDLAEAVLDAFDNDSTLGGAANAGLDPASTVPEPVTVRGKEFVYFTILLKAKAIKSLS